MPFTFSHPAIVLPLAAKRVRLSATGLIIGSMTPDFEYFIRMKDLSRYSHTLPGIFWFDVPIGVLVCFIYHLIIRNRLFDNLPVFLKSRVIVFKKFQWNDYFIRNWWVVCISTLIGAATHILWDAFTHDTMFFVQQETDLSTFLQFGTVNLAGYKFLQLASSTIGLLLVLFSIISLKRRPVPDKSIDYRYWVIASVIICAVMFMRLVGGLNIHDHRRTAVSFISSVIIALILTPMILSQLAQINQDRIAEEQPAD